MVGGLAKHFVGEWVQHSRSLTELAVVSKYPSYWQLVSKYPSYWHLVSKYPRYWHPNTPGTGTW